jgi:integrase
VKITKRIIDAATYTGTNNARCILWDDTISGFGCRIYPSGKKSFVLSYRKNGRKRLFTIGRYGSITLEQARKQAQKQFAKLIDGLDPLEDRAQGRNGETMADLCDLYLEHHSKLVKKSWSQDQGRIERHILPVLSSIKVKDITRPDIAFLHRKIGMKTPYEANSVLALLSSMFEFSIKHGYRDEASGNPAKRIDKFHEVKRDRWVTLEEMPRIAEAISNEENIYIQAALWLYLFTGARKSEVLGMKWVDVDLTQKTWRLPTTKAGRIHYIPLSQPIIELLSKIPKQKDNPYVICGKKEKSHLVNITKPWERVRKAAGTEDVRLHDLRRTVGSWLAQSGSSLHLIGRVLNHSNASTTQIYAHFGQDQVRSALDDHGTRLAEIVGTSLTIG